MGLNVNDVKLGVVGCGRMASAILGGIAKNKFLNCDDIYIYDVNIDASGKLCQEYGFREAYSIKEVFELSNVVLLAVKPFMIGEILTEVKEFYNNQLLLSILAGVKIDKFASFLNNLI